MAASTRPSFDRASVVVMHALVIDDEASARADLRTKLAAHPDVMVVGEAATLVAARELLARTDYELVFLDVQLIGGLAFELLPSVRRGANVVFATAHERYAVRALQSRAVDYLLKPIEPTRLAEALQRVNDRLPEEPRGGLPKSASRRPFRLGDSAPERDASASECRTDVSLTPEERVFLRHMLQAWEDTLPPTHVLRAPNASVRRTVQYRRDREPTHLFLAVAHVAFPVRWWRALGKRFAGHA